MPAGSTGTRCPGAFARSTRHRPRPRRRNASWSSRQNGAGSTQRSPGSGRTPGASSCRSWTTTSKSGGSSAAPTPSNPSTPATGAQSGPRPFPHRAGGPEMPLPRHQGTGPHLQRQGTMVHTMEARPERLRHQLRRKNQPNANRVSTENQTVPPRLEFGAGGRWKAVVAGRVVITVPAGIEHVTAWSFFGVKCLMSGRRAVFCRRCLCSCSSLRRGRSRSFGRRGGRGGRRGRCRVLVGGIGVLCFLCLPTS
jgi:hypothetical protein